MTTMKRAAVLLSAAAYAGAAASTLRGEGVEEVGEQFEHFPLADVRVERRLLSNDDADYEARAMMEEFFVDGADGPDVVGHLVEDEGATYVAEYQLADGEEDRFEDLQPLGRAWSHGEEEEDVVGAVVITEGGSPPDAGDATPKEYARDPNMVIFEGTSVTGEAVDQSDRRLAACGTGMSHMFFFFRTDNYAYENSWELLDPNNNVLDSGPPRNMNYEDDTSYTGQKCLPPGQNYKLRMVDAGRDGMCSGNVNTFGCGSFKMMLNGATIHDYKQGTAGWSDRWNRKDFKFTIPPFTPRIDAGGGGNGGGNNGGNSDSFCAKVKTKVMHHRGNCELPGGKQGHRVRVQLKVDKYGKETSWKIRSLNANGVANPSPRMALGPIVEKDEMKTVEQCLSPGKYELEVLDLDGVCCRHGEGFFKLHVNNLQLLDGGSFQGSIKHTFQLGFNWIDSMTERDCEWWWAHDYRRRDWHTRCYQGPSGYCDKKARHLKWSPALKADAQKYATELLATCDTTGIKHDKTDQGENLAKNKGSGAWGQLYSTDKVTGRFVDNEEFWGWNRNAHLTQAMWYPSRYIGCAESEKSLGGNKMCRMQVCRFAKAGNCMMGKYESEKGDNWMIPMMADDSPCGPMCASRDGCFH